MLVLKTQEVLSQHPWANQINVCETLKLPLVVLNLTDALALPRLVSPVANGQGGAEAASQCGGLSVFDAGSVAYRQFGAASVEEFDVLFQNTLKLECVDQYKSLLDAVEQHDISSAFLQLQSHTDKRTWRLEFVAAKVSGMGCFALATMANVTEQAAQIQKSQRLEQLCEHLSDFIGVVGLDGNFEILNDAGRRMVGCSVDRGGFKATEIMTSAGCETLKNAKKFVNETNQPWVGTLRIRHRGNAESQDLNVRLSPVYAPRGGGISGYSIVGTRQTAIEKLRQEVEMRDKLIEEAGRLVMLGQISSQVIHEISNPMTVITGKAEKIINLACRAEPDMKALIDCGEKILRMTRRTEKIIRSVKALAFKPPMPIDKPLALGSVIEDVRDLIEVGSGRFGVEVRIPEISPQIYVRAERVKLSQVFVNLFSNAYDAVSRGDDRWVELTVDVDSEWLFIRLVDSGPGVPKEIEPRLFEGFFTTKEPGQGTGMGLNLSRQLIRAAGGDLYLDKTTKLTTFVIRLPKVEVPTASEGDGWDKV